jgi:low temperature requirement protein LtrA
MLEGQQGLGVPFGAVVNHNDPAKGLSSLIEPTMVWRSGSRLGSDPLWRTQLSPRSVVHASQSPSMDAHCSLTRVSCTLIEAPATVVDNVSETVSAINEIVLVRIRFPPRRDVAPPYPKAAGTGQAGFVSGSRPGKRARVPFALEIGRDRSMPEREQRVTPIELFFDLVFVYAITQVTTLMWEDLTWRGVGRGLLALAALWWGWTGYAWLTNMLEPEDGVARAGMFCGMAAMLVAALAVPDAFGRKAVLFGVAFLLVRLCNLGLYMIAGKREPEFRGAVVRFAPTASIGPILILVAGFLDGTAQVVVWVIAILALYSGPLIDRGQGWQISPAHFAERYGLIVIIALGESIVALGIAAAGVDLTAAVIAAAVVGLAVIAALWWAYFDVFAVLGEQQLSRATGADRARLARDNYSYLHMPMIAGIVLFALGLRITTHDVAAPLATLPAVALCGGLSLYYLVHVVVRIRLVAFIRRGTEERPAWIGPGRLAATIATLACIPAAVALPALAALGLVAAVGWALIVWDVFHYREHRVQIRQARH